MPKAATGYSTSQVTAAPGCGGAGPRVPELRLRGLRQQTHRPVDPSTRRQPDARQHQPDRRPGDQHPGGGPAAYSPQFLQQAHDTGWLSATQGVGRTVAVVDACGDPNAQSDLDTFRSSYGLPAISHSACTAAAISAHSGGGPCMVEVNHSGDSSALPSPSDGWDVEESLDLAAGGRRNS